MQRWEQRWNVTNSSQTISGMLSTSFLHMYSIRHMVSPQKANSTCRITLAEKRRRLWALGCDRFASSGQLWTFSFEICSQLPSLWPLKRKSQDQRDTVQLHRQIKLLSSSDTGQMITHCSQLSSTNYWCICKDDSRINMSPALVPWHCILIQNMQILSQTQWPIC